MRIRRCLRPAAATLAALALLFILAAACTPGGRGTGVPRGGAQTEVLRLALTREPSTIDPAKATTLEERLLVQALYAGLVAYAPGKDRPVPALAERWESSGDGLVYTFYLRRTAFFGGRPLTADDVKYSLSRLVDPAVGSPWAYLLANVAGAEAYGRGEADEVEGLKALDAHTLQITLLRPQEDFLYALAQPAAAVVDRLSLEAAGQSFGRPGSPIASLVTGGGSGPYAAVEWIRNRLLVLQANPAYYAEPPALSRLEIYFADPETAYLDFLSGRVDLVVGLDARHLKEAASDSYLGGRVALFPLAGAVYLAWTTDEPTVDWARAAAALDAPAVAQEFAGLLEPLPRMGPSGAPFPPAERAPAAGSPELLRYPEDGLGLGLTAEDTRLLAERLAEQLAEAVGRPLRAVAEQEPAAGLRLGVTLAPHPGASAPSAEADGETRLLPLFRPRLAALVGERVEGFTPDPYGFLCWAEVRLVPPHRAGPEG